MSAPAEFLDHALAYAARGWPVFPLIPKGVGGAVCVVATESPA